MRPVTHIDKKITRRNGLEGRYMNSSTNDSGKEISDLAGGDTLLSAMWRSGEAAHQIATKYKVVEKEFFKNIPVKDIPDALKRVGALSEGGRDGYFACAEYINGDSRKASNALGAWAYWFDIDCGQAKADKGLGYATKKEAAAALTAFIKQTKLPDPDFIVDSGNGLHVYFCSDEFIPAAEWKVGADKLKALTKQYGLLADDTRTADIASVLRVPGTYNYKDPSKPKLVKVVYQKGGEA